MENLLLKFGAHLLAARGCYYQGKEEMPKIWEVARDKLEKSYRYLDMATPWRDRLNY